MVVGGGSWGAPVPPPSHRRGTTHLQALTTDYCVSSWQGSRFLGVYNLFLTTAVRTIGLLGCIYEFLFFIAAGKGNQIEQRHGGAASWYGELWPTGSPPQALSVKTPGSRHFTGWFLLGSALLAPTFSQVRSSTISDFIHGCFVVPPRYLSGTLCLCASCLAPMSCCGRPLH